MLAASLPRLSACGADVTRRIVRREGIDGTTLIDDCCCRRAANATMPSAWGDSKIDAMRSA